MDKNELKQAIREILNEEYQGWKAPVLPGGAEKNDILVAKESFIDPPLDVSNKVKWQHPVSNPEPIQDVNWGDIGGSLENQTDLKEVLDAHGDDIDTNTENIADHEDRIQALEDAPPGSTEWGDITGSLSNQTDLVNALLNKADKNNTYTKDEVDSKDNAKVDKTTKVNNKALSGDIELSASDIKATNTQSIQANLERIDGNVEDNRDDIEQLQDDVADKSTVSGTHDGTNWTKINIDGVEKDIPAGGSGGGDPITDIDPEDPPEELEPNKIYRETEYRYWWKFWTVKPGLEPYREDAEVGDIGISLSASQYGASLSVLQFVGPESYNWQTVKGYYTLDDIEANWTDGDNISQYFDAGTDKGENPEVTCIVFYKDSEWDTEETITAQSIGYDPWSTYRFNTETYVDMYDGRRHKLMTNVNAPLKKDTQGYINLNYDYKTLQLAGENYDQLGVKVQQNGGILVDDYNGLKLDPSKVVDAYTKTESDNRYQQKLTQGLGILLDGNTVGVNLVGKTYKVGDYGETGYALTVASGVSIYNNQLLLFQLEHNTTGGGAGLAGPTTVRIYNAGGITISISSLTAGVGIKLCDIKNSSGQYGHINGIIPVRFYAGNTYQSGIVTFNSGYCFFIPFWTGTISGAAPSVKIDFD